MKMRLGAGFTGPMAQLAWFRGVVGIHVPVTNVPGSRRDGRAMVLSYETLRVWLRLVNL